MLTFIFILVLYFRRYSCWYLVLLILLTLKLFNFKKKRTTYAKIRKAILFSSSFLFFFLRLISLEFLAKVAEVAKFSVLTIFYPTRILYYSMSLRMHDEARKYHSLLVGRLWYVLLGLQVYRRFKYR